MRPSAPLERMSTDLTEPPLSLADITDFAAIFNPLDSKLFPGLSHSIQVHQGFANDQAK